MAFYTDLFTFHQHVNICLIIQIVGIYEWMLKRIFRSQSDGTPALGVKQDGKKREAISIVLPAM